jgi:uncharacterized delta-60 repeat protein
LQRRTHSDVAIVEQFIMSTSRRRSSRNVVESLESRTLLAVNDLDTGFSGNGWVTTNFSGGYDNVRALAVQKDGKVIMVGEAGSLGFAAVRFNADGSLDDGSQNDSTPGDHFGTGGKFTFVPPNSTNAGANAVAIQRDGKIVIAGSAFAGSQQYWELLRLNADGSFDKTFGFDHNGQSGLELSIYNTPLTGMVLQSDGKIVVCGSANSDFLVGRFTTTGDLDNSFDGGTVLLDFGGTDSAAGVAIDYLGRILVGGGVGGNGIKQDVGVARFLTDGSLDTSFGVNGKGVYKQGSEVSNTEVTGIVVEDDGRIKLSGAYYQAGTWLGTLFDFSADGIGTGSSSIGTTKLNGVALMANGDFATTGTYLGTNQASSTFMTLISPADKRTVSLGATASSGIAVAAAPDGGVFAAGYADFSGHRDFALAKFVGVDPSTWGAISGNVYRDTDGDHVQDSNEKGMGNVRVYVDVNNDGKWSPIFGDPEPNVYTDSSGNFTIKNIKPGKYVVREVVPAGTTQTNPSSVFYSVAVAGGKTTKGLVFSNEPKAAATTQTAINGSVFNDWNSNAKRDISKPTEPDLANIVVFIDSNKNGKLDSKETQTKTDAGGNYTLNLPRGGTYRVAVAIPSSWINTTPAFYDVKVTTHAQATERFGLTFKDDNDTIAEVKTAAAIAPGKSVSGSLASDVDVNLYRIVIGASETISFDLDAASGSSIDSYLRLFDAKGNQLAFNDNAAAPGEGAGIDSYLKYHFSKTGTYYLAVSDHLNTGYSATSGTQDIGGGTKGKYSLTIKLV